MLQFNMSVEKLRGFQDKKNLHLKIVIESDLVMSERIVLA